MTPDAVEGLITNEAGAALAHHASLVPVGQAIVEVGSFAGKSTCYLATAARPGVAVYAVDTWDLIDVPFPRRMTTRAGDEMFDRGDVRRRFAHNLAACGVADRVTAVQAFSVDAAKAYAGPPVGLLYIDGDHTQAGCQADVNAWWPHLAPRATVVFDDFNRGGVGNVVRGLGLGVEVVVGRFAVVRP